MDENISTMTMPKTMPVQNLLRYISFHCTKMSADKPAENTPKCPKIYLPKSLGFR